MTTSFPNGSLPYIGIYNIQTETIDWQNRRPPFDDQTPPFKSAIRSKNAFVHTYENHKFAVDLYRELAHPNGDLVIVSSLHQSGVPRPGEFAFHSQVLRFMSQSVIVSDLDQRILVWNRAAEKIYGWKADEVLGKKITDLSFSQTYIENIQSGLIDKIKEKGEIHVEGLHRRKDGEEFPVRIFNSAIYDTEGDVYALISVTSDITEEKQVKSDLLAGQQEIELLFNNTLYGAFFMMMDEPIEWGPHVDKEAVLDYVFEHQRVTRINQAMLDQYRATKDQFIGTRPKDFFAHNIREGREVWRKFFDLGRWRVETDERRMDGTRVIFEGDYFLLYDEAGRIIGHFGVQQDVTERKENDERLRLSEKKLKKLTENVPGAIFEFVRDQNGNYFFDFLSAGVEAFQLGVPIDELYNDIQVAFDLIHPEDVQKVFDLLNKTLPNQQLTFEFRIRIENGDYLWLHSISNTEMLENGEMRWYGIFEDITEEKRKSDELQRLALVAQNTSDYILICDEMGRVSWVNTEQESSLGFAHREIIGHSFLEMISTQSIDSDKCTELYRAYEQRATFSLHLSVRRRNGEIGYFEYRGTPIFSEADEFEYFLIVERDITDMYEKQNELMRAIRLTKEQNARLREFTYIISHNVRSHSVNFTALTGLLRREKDEVEKKRIVELLTNVSENLEQTIQHLNSVVSASESSREDHRYVNLKTLIDNELVNMSQEVARTEAVIHTEVAEEMKVYGIPAYLESILHNLISNAIKYRHPDRHPEINIKARHTGNGVELIIADNGLGIDLEKYGDKLFGMYRTFHKSTNSRGIGLYLTKNQLDAMGAEITVNSQVGEGTIFQLFFPDDFED